MKKILFPVLVVMLFSYETAAQFKKGKRMAGASVGSILFSSGKSEYSYPAPTTGFTSTNNRLSISANPSMGWFVSDNTAIGAQLVFGYTSSKLTDESAANGNTFNKNNSSGFNLGIGGFARNYFSSTGMAKPFGQFSLNFGTGSSSSDGFYFAANDKSTFDGKSSGDFFINASLAFGFTRMLNDHTGLDFFAGYNYSYNKNTFKTTTQVDLGNNGSIDQTAVSEPTNKFTGHGFTIGVGFQVFLDRKK
jgi:hypothetical protein